jgi:hypothetical protein
MLRNQRADRRQIIATKRAALQTDRFHWTHDLHHQPKRVQWKKVWTFFGLDFIAH